VLSLAGQGTATRAEIACQLNTSWRTSLAKTRKKGWKTTDHKNKLTTSLSGRAESLQMRLSSVKQKGIDLMESSGINCNFTGWLI